MANLTDLQKERISFHLDYVERKYLLAISRDTLILTLNDSQKLALVGQDLTGLDASEIYVFHGVDLCTNISQLGKVERAYEQLDPDVISDSLFVSQAGSVTLRGNETSNRLSLYKLMVKKLAQLIGGMDSSSRVGHG